MSSEQGVNSVTFQDEFGGYSSRLRHQKGNGRKKQKVSEEDETDLNLCKLLGINIEEIAMKVAMDVSDLEDEE